MIILTFKVCVTQIIVLYLQCNQLNNFIMNQEIFNYNERNIKFDLINKNNLQRKIKHCFKYLKNHLPVNVLEKDNNFDFSKINYDEGKNYNFFYLVNDKVEILIRQYSTHFTFYTCTKHEHSFLNKFAVFTIYGNTEKMEGDLSDSFCDDNFKTISDLLPSLVEMMEENNLHSIWNDYSLVRPNYIEIELALIGDESIYSLDKLIFACDELFSIYLCKFAENDTLAKLKDLKVGDNMGGYIIEEVLTDVKNDYYHSAGVKYYNPKFPPKKIEWSDIYSLTRYHYEGMFFGDLKNKIKDFLHVNHNKVIDRLIANGQKFIFETQITNEYIEAMRVLFVGEIQEVDKPTFFQLIDKTYINFIYHSFVIKKLG